MQKITAQLITLTVLGTFLLMLHGCKDPEPVAPEEGSLELSLRPVINGQDFQPDVAYENPSGRQFFLNLFKLYLADITLIKANGEEVLLSEVELYDLAEPGNDLASTGVGTSRTFEVEVGDYQGIRFGIGVPARYNLNDPAEFGAEHPLSTFNGMHWSWASGYRFVVMEGRMDGSPQADGVLLAHPLAYHTGLDTLYRSITFDQSGHGFSLEADERERFVVQLDINRMFFSQTDTLDMLNRNLSHTMPPNSPEYFIAEEITNNLVANALSKEPF